ncbi:hypothetical protein ACR3K2_02820 [Cryptosporidium serpentis]
MGLLSRIASGLYFGGNYIDTIRYKERRCIGSKIISSSTKLLESQSSHCTSGNTVLRKLWPRNSSEISTRINSNEESHSLKSHETNSCTTFLIPKSNLNETQDYLKVGGDRNNIRIKEDENNNTNIIIDAENYSNIVISFNYKSYPISLNHISNWMNAVFSKSESIDINRASSEKKITPFHSLIVPKVSIGEYYTSRLMKFIGSTPVDFCVTLILLKRTLENSGGTLQITSLTAHRLILAASIVTHKLMYDVQYGLKFWAYIGGVPQWEMVMLEYHILRLLNWNLNINYDEFYTTYSYVISGRKNDINTILINEIIPFNRFKKKNNNYDHVYTSKCTKIQLSVTKPMSNRNTLMQSSK